MASRRKGRILAFQALYSWDVHYSQTGDVSIPDGLLEFSWSLKPGAQASSSEAVAFSRLLVTGTVENIACIDSMIQKHLKNWNIERLSRVDLAVLRMSAYALMFQSDMPPTIVINEAIGISKEFGSSDSYRFVNGVLDGILKTLASGPQAG
ncbi:MAG: transcription antitermination factor NusB [Treponema sp.]|nr:transcription antitermination factor NusB [Treponema sp.]